MVDSADVERLVADLGQRGGTGLRPVREPTSDTAAEPSRRSLPADLNRDGVVDGDDLRVALGRVGQPAPMGCKDICCGGLCGDGDGDDDDGEDGHAKTPRAGRRRPDGWGDPDRFFVRVYDGSVNEDLSAVETVEARISTLLPGISPPVDDDETTLTLKESGDDTGVFDSKPLLLMSSDLPPGDNPDDEVEVWSDRVGETGAFVSDDQLNDRTHRATLGGEVKAFYDAPNAVQPVTLMYSKLVAQPEPGIGDPDDGVKTLPLRVRVHLEPYKDEGVVDLSNPQFPVFGFGNGQFDFSDWNGNGVHDAGEPSEPYRDLSRFDPSNMNLDPPDFAQGDQLPNDVGDGRGPVVTMSQILAELERANIGWAQAGIKVEMIAGPIIEPAPTSAGQDVLHDGWLDITSSNQATDPSDDQIVILSIGGAATPDVAEVIFTGPMMGAAGFARVPANQGSTLPGTLEQNTYLFVRPNVDIRLRTLAHEIGHALTNHPDGVFPPYIFFPFLSVPPPLDNAPDQQRRIRHDTEGTARTERMPPGCLTCDGNTLLFP